MDTRTPEQRRRIMQSVKSKNTAPELVVRKLLHSMGFRFRLHPKDLPGKPDIVFRSKKRAINVNGCFWHGHGCPKGQLPKSRLEYWGPKITANKARDARKRSELEELDWRLLDVWQCEIDDHDALEKKLRSFLQE
ncbi:very short patch repair endonuclease [Roseibium sediminicola]|uniref:Very short patch repair endonuclease n=1 Tax=Roseibium sediminicola TaxID=2933272 RepID=A0ABT0H1F3_9HYPH|nr:very short patch repair endonuclease [Roseibium sp. CAU 1639]MCK7615527.1 very short patch repair endonuclease [Roseibium sp. CAU 1639]